MRANAAKLVNTGKRADRRVILNQYMTGQCSRVCHDDVIAENTVVAHVHICHEEVVITDPGIPAAAFRSTMDIHVFAKRIVIANRQKCFFAFEFQILRFQTDGRKRIEPVAFANLRGPFHHDMRLEAAPFSNPNARANPAVRSNPHVLANLRFRTDNGGGMDHGC